MQKLISVSCYAKIVIRLNPTLRVLPEIRIEQLYAIVVESSQQSNNSQDTGHGVKRVGSSVGRAGDLFKYLH